MSVNVVILAAGQGTRMHSKTPKVLHTLGGVSLLERVIKTASQLNPAAIQVVYGNGGNLVQDALKNLNLKWVEQKEQLGTGHALLQAMPHWQDDDRILVLYGDVPLISAELLQTLLQRATQDEIGLITANLSNPAGFGRIVRNAENKISSIVEEKDASAEQRKITEVNTGIVTAPARLLKRWLPNLKNNNAQQELYLTDIIALAALEHCVIHAVEACSIEEVQGVNDRAQLATLERYYQQKTAQYWMQKGVTLVDPMRVDFRGEDIEIAADVTIDINVVLMGSVKINENCFIGPNVILKNVTIGKNVVVEANSLIEGADIGDGCQIGPFARVRPGTVLRQNVKIGNFVEIKKSTLGANSKANHLSYLGDATIGKDVNIGAGAITCNYDGANKWNTLIEDDVFIGSNTSLVAPVAISKGATIGAGSTITQNAPPESLTLSRSRQTTIERWQRPKKK